MHNCLWSSLFVQQKCWFKKIDDVPKNVDFYFSCADSAVGLFVVIFCCTTEVLVQNG